MGPAAPAFSGLNATHVRAERDAFTPTTAALADGPTHIAPSRPNATHIRADLDAPDRGTAAIGERGWTRATPSLLTLQRHAHSHGARGASRSAARSAHAQL